MKIPQPTKPKRPKAFIAACDDYLALKKVALMASIAGTHNEAALLAHVREELLLPTETEDDLNPRDLFGIYPEGFHLDIKAGRMTEREAKREIGKRVEGVMETWTKI